MSQFFIKLFDRDFRAVLALPDMTITPLRWGSLAVGGPEFAIVQVDGPRAALLLVEVWLRYGVEIFNELGQCVWWGYVESYQLETPTSSSSNSVDDLSNSIKIEYGEAATGFEEDASSVAEYGRKQTVLPVSPALSNSVAQRQATELAQRSEPQPIPGERGEQSRATLYCVGWLKTLGWLFYSRAEGLVEYVGTGSREQVFGLGVQDNEFWFVNESREIHDTGMNLYDFQRGQRIAVSGSASNNTTYTVARTTANGPAGVTISHQLNFLASNKTIYRYGSTGPGEMAWLRPGDRIHITGTGSNNGWYFVTGVSPSWADMWITVADSINNEIATNPVLWRGHAIGLEEQPVEEKPGANVTLVVDGSRLAQRFKPLTSWSLYQVAVKLRKVGAPGDGVWLTICADSSGLPGGGLVSQVVAAASISSNSAWAEFVFTSPLALTGGTYYWIVIERSGSLDTDNYYSISLDEDAGYGDGYLRMWNGSAWVARTVEATMLFRAQGQEETTAQIAELVDAAGQFLTGTHIDNASGVQTLQFRDGIADAKTELTDLLSIGTSNARRLLCAVEQDRALRVREEPAYSGTPDYLERLDGQFVAVQGTPLPPGQLIAGTWLRTESPLAPAQGVNVDPTLRFVERCEYDAVSGRYKNTPRGAPNIWRLAVAPAR